DKINLAGAAIHRPEAIAFVIIIAEIGEVFGGGVHDPQVGGGAAAIVFARPSARMAGESELRPVGRIAARRTPVGLDRLLHPALSGNLPERGNAGEDARTARRFKNDL